MVIVLPARLTGPSAAPGRAGCPEASGGNSNRDNNNNNNNNNSNK